MLTDNQLYEIAADLNLASTIGTVDEITNFIRTEDIPPEYLEDLDKWQVVEILKMKGFSNIGGEDINRSTKDNIIYAYEKYIRTKKIILEKEGKITSSVSAPKTRAEWESNKIRTRYDVENCEDNYADDIKDELERNDVYKYPKSKVGMCQVLKSIKENNRCNPNKDENCNKYGEACNIVENPEKDGFCIDEDLLDKKGTKYASYNGYPIYGSVRAMDNLDKKKPSGFYNKEPMRGSGPTINGTTYKSKLPPLSYTSKFELGGLNNSSILTGLSSSVTNQLKQNNGSIIDPKTPVEKSLEEFRKVNSDSSPYNAKGGDAQKEIQKMLDKTFRGKVELNNLSSDKPNDPENSENIKKIEELEELLHTSHDQLSQAYEELGKTKTKIDFLEKELQELHENRPGTKLDNIIREDIYRRNNEGNNSESNSNNMRTLLSGKVINNTPRGDFSQNGTSTFDLDRAGTQESVRIKKQFESDEESNSGLNTTIPGPLNVNGFFTTEDSSSAARRLKKTYNRSEYSATQNNASGPSMTNCRGLKG